MIYINSIINQKPIEERIAYPYNIPSILHFNKIDFRNNVSFIIGENGSGKSTFIEALAICAGFSPEGGSIFLNHGTYNSHSELFNSFKLIRSGYRNKDGFFLRAESFYNVASELDRISKPFEIEKNYGGSLHERSHGESFIALLKNRLSGNGLYIFDEPESALSIVSQLSMLVRIKELAEKDSQLIIATHSPILMAYPNSDIFCMTNSGLQLVNYEDTEQYKLTKYFISNYHKVFRELGI